MSSMDLLVVARKSSTAFASCKAHSKRSSTIALSSGFTCLHRSTYAFTTCSLLICLVRIICARLTAGISKRLLDIGGNFCCLMLNVFIQLYGTTNKLKNTIAPRNILRIIQLMVLQSWAVYRTAPATFRVEYIDPKYCTHLMYTFAGLNLDGTIDTLDYENDITKGGYKAFTGLKEKYPCVKILLAIGGWNEGSEKYSLMVETEESREYFVSRVLRYLVHFGFDGLDIDWEYPAHRGGIPADRENFVKLLEMLKERLKPRKYLLTAALAASVGIIEDAYDVPEMCKYLDLVMIMGYDMNEANKTSTHSPLKRETSETSTRPIVDDAVQYYAQNGCDKKQLVLGIPAYGKSYTLADKSKHAIGANVKGPGTAGPYLLEPGFLGYNEICESLAQAQWTTVHLKSNAVKYSYNDDQWVSYDDAETVTAKTNYAKTEGLAGVMIWTIDTDDFHGDCSKQAFPLLVAANKALGRF